MDSKDIFNYLVAILGLYLCWRGNKHFERQNQIMEREGRQVLPSSRTRSWTKRYWPLIAMAILFVANCSVTAWDTYDRRIKNNASDVSQLPSERIEDRAFENENVLLDGHDFIQCSFENVTFVENGTAGCSFFNCFIKGSTGITTQNLYIDYFLKAYLPMMEMMNARGGTTEIQWFDKDGKRIPPRHAQFKIATTTQTTTPFPMQ